MTCVVQRETASLILVEEFAHRALNDYMLAIASLDLAARRVEDPAVRGQIAQATARLHAVANAHRALAMPAGGTQCHVGDYMGAVCAALANAINSHGGVRLQLEVGSTVLPAEQCWRLALIVSELIHNAARHGGPTGEILVELSSADDLMTCRVSNIGECEAAPTLGRGRRVVLALTREMGGWADWLFSPSGACASVVVPLDRA